MTWSEYVAGLTKGETQDQAAERIGTSAPTVSRWLAGSKPNAATAVAVARAYGDSPLNALVAVGFITANEARQRPAAQPSLEGISDDDLIELVTKRIKRGGGGHVDGSATNTDAGERRLSAVAGTGATPEQAKEASKRAARSKAEQQAAIAEMERKKRDDED